MIFGVSSGIRRGTPRIRRCNSTHLAPRHPVYLALVQNTDKFLMPALASVTKLGVLSNCSLWSEKYPYTGWFRAVVQHWTTLLGRSCGAEHVNNVVSRSPRFQVTSFTLMLLCIVVIVWRGLCEFVEVKFIWRDMSYGLESFSTEASVAQLKVIVHVAPNELYGTWSSVTRHWQLETRLTGPNHTNREVLRNNTLK
jgi:hypothetical protein